MSGEVHSFVCMCVQTFMRVCAHKNGCWFTCMCVLGILLTTLFFEPGSLVDPEFTESPGLADEPAPGMPLYLALSTGIESHWCAAPSSSMCCWGLNLGPNDFIASTLPTKPKPISQCLFLFSFLGPSFYSLSIASFFLFFWSARLNSWKIRKLCIIAYSLNPLLNLCKCLLTTSITLYIQLGKYKLMNAIKAFIKFKM